MTHGGMLYLVLVLATFGFFSLGIGTASLRQTQRDRRAAAARRASGA